ncbi:MAG: hypothetical protein PWQ92_786 [Thermococcaceae archaeon]|jgi:rubrerythrin|nr:hypothetical protein [Thermococcaceae archaeon]
MREVPPTVKENIKKLLQTLPKLSMKEILSYWINAEVEEAEMYHRLYELSKELTWIEEVPKVFRKLSEESLEHAEELLRLYKKLFPGEKPIPVNLPPLEVVLAEPELERFLEKGRAEELFDILMENEKMAAEAYEYLSKLSENPEVKEVAKWLAEIEWGHYNHIKALKEKYLSLKDNATQ